MAAIYGSPNGRAFAREVLEVMCSNDPQRVKAFNVRLFSKVGEQLALKFSAPAVEAFPGEPAVRGVRSSRGKRKPRRKRGARGRTP